MADFDPLTDYYHRRQAALLDRHAQGVELVTRKSTVYPGNFFDPTPSLTPVIEH